jgi:RNA polymerase sigma-70 factor (ECF subfamily)
MAEPLQDVAQYLPAARSGSREALGRALEAYRAYLLLIANGMLAPELRAKGGASDVVQETFLEAQRDFAQFCGTSAEELQAWLRQLLLHNLANLARRYRDTGKRLLSREVALEEETPSGVHGQQVMADTPSPSSQAIAREQSEAVQRALEQLPKDYRQVIVWRYQEGRSFAEIAARLQRSENAARKLWFRALERLQQALGEVP